jgi:hypothetical protein
MRVSSSLVNRRSVLLSGAAAVAAMSLPAGAIQPGLAPPSELLALGIEVTRLRRRCARQGHRVRHLAAQAEDLATSRGIGLVGRSKRHNAARDALRDEVGYHAAWARWLASVDEIAALIDRIARHPARSINDMIIKYESLRWSLLDDGAVFDAAVRRQVVAFRRDLLAFVGSRQPCLGTHWPCRPEQAC